MIVIYFDLLVCCQWFISFNYYSEDVIICYRRISLERGLNLDITYPKTIRKPNVRYKYQQLFSDRAHAAKHLVDMVTRTTMLLVSLVGFALLQSAVCMTNREFYDFAIENGAGKTLLRFSFVKYSVYYNRTDAKFVRDLWPCFDSDGYYFLLAIYFLRAYIVIFSKQYD